MQAFGAFSPNKMKFYGEKHPHLPIYSAKRGKIVPLWLRTYFRGGTVLYLVGALEDTAFS